MTLDLIVAITFLIASIGLFMLLGFRLGRTRSEHEMLNVRMQAARAGRQLHDLTRQAFTAMAEAAETHRRPSD